MELDNYRNFLAIIEAGSFTGAADYVHIAQRASASSCVLWKTISAPS